MQRKTRKIILAVAVIGALAAGGAAFTATNTFTGHNVAGYGTQSVSGATVSDTKYTLSADGTKIDQVDLTFSPAIHGSDSTPADTVVVGFGASGAAPTSVAIPCTVAHDGLTAKCGGIEGGPDAIGVANINASSGSFAVAVTNN